MLCRSRVHVVLRVDVSLDLGFHVVIGVGRLNGQQVGRQLHFTTHTQYQVQSSFLLEIVVRLCPVIVHFICIPNSCIFHIAKNGSLEVLYLHLLNPNSLFQSFFKEIFGGGRGDIYTFSCMTSPGSILTTFGIQYAGSVS